MAETVEKQTVWFTLTPEEVAKELQVDLGQGVKCCRSTAAPAEVRPQPAGRQAEGTRLAGLPAPV